MWRRKKFKVRHYPIIRADLARVNGKAPVISDPAALSRGTFRGLPPAYSQYFPGFAAPSYQLVLSGRPYPPRGGGTARGSAAESTASLLNGRRAAGKHVATVRHPLRWAYKRKMAMERGG